MLNLIALQRATVLSVRKPGASLAGRSLVLVRAASRSPEAHEGSEHKRGPGRPRKNSEERGSASASSEGRAHGGHVAQEHLHQGKFKNEHTVDVGPEVVKKIQEGLDSDDPKERIRAGGMKGGKITQAQYHGEDPSELRKVHGHKHEEEAGEDKKH